MNIKTLSTLICLFCFCCCTQCATLRTQTDLEQNLSQLLWAQAGIEITPTCQMIEQSRSGLCYFSEPAETVEHLVNGLDLQTVNRADEAAWDVFIAMELPQGNCRADTEFSDSAVTHIYSSKTSRPPELRLENRDVFEQVILYHNTTSNEICLQVTIAYG